VPVNKVVLLTQTQGKYTRVLENILGRLAVTKNLSYHQLGEDGQCRGSFLGTKDVSIENLCNFKIVRDSIGEEPVIVTMIGDTDHRDIERQDVNKTELEEIEKSIDLCIVAKEFRESLVVLKQLLCLDFRDITYVDTDKDVNVVEVQNTEAEEHFARQLHKIIEEIGQDEVIREMDILDHANHYKELNLGVSS